MPVDLRALPAPLATPEPPARWRWCLIVLATAFLLGVVALLLWPPAWAGYALWFWCCTLVLPLMAGFGLYALRLRGYEEQREYVQGWNLHYDAQRATLIERGQRFIEVVGYAYCTPAGNNLVAQALSKGAKGLQSLYVPSLMTTLSVGQLVPVARDDSLEEYEQRLAGFFRQVMANLDKEIQRHTHLLEAPLSVRIRHDQVLSDAQVLTLWQEVDGVDRQAARVVFAGPEEDGLLWLDAWLDAAEAVPLLLSLEVHLFQELQSQQAESVSGMLLVHPSLGAQKRTQPLAHIHRPVQITDMPLSLEDALRWGHLERREQEFFTWQSQLPGGFAEEAGMVVRSMGYASSPDQSHCLDGSLGSPMNAVGHMALIIACEQANASGQAQFLVVQDASLQCCVVRPVSVAQQG